MRYGEYVLGGYLLSAIAVGLYALRVLVRGRQLSKQVPPEDRRWT